MNKKKIIELIIAIIMMIIGTVILILPIMEISNSKIILFLVMISYGILSLLKYISVKKAHDIDGLLTFIASLVIIIMLCFIDVNAEPFKLAFVLFIWVIMMSLIKLKKSDYYHDRKNKEWIIKIVSLCMFILVGILASINLYNIDAQSLVLGFFFLIHGMLELIEPITSTLIEKK